MEVKVESVEKAQDAQTGQFAHLQATLESELRVGAPTTVAMRSSSSSSGSGVHGRTPRFRSSRRVAAEQAAMATAKDGNASEGIPPVVRFEDVDTDGDGQITRAEWEQAALQRPPT
jgi:hypothetical protein